MFPSFITIEAELAVHVETVGINQLLARERRDLAVDPEQAVCGKLETVLLLL